MYNILQFKKRDFMEEESLAMSLLKDYKKSNERYVKYITLQI